MQRTAAFNPLSALVTPTWLASHLQTVTVIDASWFMPSVNRDAAADHRRTRIPGARFLDIDDSSSGFCAADTSLPHMLPSAKRMARGCASLGMKPDRAVVVYTAKSPPFCASARVWWMLRTFGKSDVYVLDGGLPAWISAGMSIEHAGDMDGGIVPPPTVDDGHAAEQLLQFKLNPALVKTLDHMLDRPLDEIVIDARPQGRFDGTAPEARPGLSSGHMPGSLNVPSSEVIGQNGLMKTPQELYDVFTKRSVNVDRLAQLSKEGSTAVKVTTTCGSGVTAAILGLALHQLGIESSLFDGSWTEYAGHDKSPILKTGE